MHPSRKHNLTDQARGLSIPSRGVCDLMEIAHEPLRPAQGLCVRLTDWLHTYFCTQSLAITAKTNLPSTSLPTDFPSFGHRPGEFCIFELIESYFARQIGAICGQIITKPITSSSKLGCQPKSRIEANPSKQTSVANAWMCPNRDVVCRISDMRGIQMMPVCCGVSNLQLSLLHN